MDKEPERVIGFIGHPDAGATTLAQAVNELAPTPVVPVTWPEGVIIPLIEIDWGYEDVAPRPDCGTVSLEDRETMAKVTGGYIKNQEFSVNLEDEEVSDMT